jgi:hypothetical protein
MVVMEGDTVRRLREEEVVVAGAVARVSRGVDLTRRGPKHSLCRR